MGGGLALVGAAGYGFVALAGHTLSTADAAAVASLYLLVNIIGPGLFSALEQETSRSTSARLVTGGGVGEVARRALLLATVLLAAVLVVLGASSPVLTGKVLAGHWGLLVAVLLSVVTSAAVYLVRGLLGGTQRFSGYAATLAAEGLARILPCLLIAVSGMPNATGYALVFAAGSGFGAIAGLAWLRRAPADLPVPDVALSEPTGPGVAGSSVAHMARALSYLAAGNLLMLVVMNVAPVVVTPRLADDTATAAAFASAFLLARIPLFLFAPVQAMLLPALTRSATTGDLAGVRALLRRILLAVAAIGVPGALASFLIGPWAVDVLFGAQVRLSGTVVGLLGVSTVALMTALVLQPGLVALGQHRIVTISWLAGTVVLGVLLAVPGDPVHAGVLGQLAGSVLVVVIMLTALAKTLAVRESAGRQPPAHSRLS